MICTFRLSFTLGMSLSVLIARMSFGVAFDRDASVHLPAFRPRDFGVLASPMRFGILVRCHILVKKSFASVELRESIHGRPVVVTFVRRCGTLSSRIVAVGVRGTCGIVLRVLRLGRRDLANLGSWWRARLLARSRTPSQGRCRDTLMARSRTVPELDEFASQAMIYAESKDMPGVFRFWIAVWTVLAAVAGGRERGWAI